MKIKTGFMESIDIQAAGDMVQVTRGLIKVMFSKSQLTGIAAKPQIGSLTSNIVFMGNGTELGKISIQTKHAMKALQELNSYFQL